MKEPKTRFIPIFAIAAFATISLSPLPAEAQDEGLITECFAACAAYYEGQDPALYQGCRQECIRSDGRGGANPPGGTKPISDKYCDPISTKCSKA